MEQPLCHLYFLTVMEHLWSKHLQLNNNKVSALVRLADFILSQLANVRDGETVLLRIELQALVQVLIHHLANHLDPEQTQKLGDFQIIIDELNR